MDEKKGILINKTSMSNSLRIAKYELTCRRTNNAISHTGCKIRIHIHLKRCRRIPAFTYTTSLIATVSFPCLAPSFAGIRKWLFVRTPRRRIEVRKQILPSHILCASCDIKPKSFACAKQYKDAQEQKTTWHSVEKIGVYTGRII